MYIIICLEIKAKVLPAGAVKLVNETQIARAAFNTQVAEQP